MFRRLKKFGTKINGPISEENKKCDLSVFVLPRASKIDDVGKLSVVIGLLKVLMKKDSI